MTPDPQINAHKGRMSFHAGIAAEYSVERYYLARGYRLLAHRWRGKSGEIDLAFQADREVVFVEVKKSGSFAQAADRVSRRQIQRIFASACEFVSTQPLGMLTPMRFDIALCNDSGEITILKNALHND